MLVHRQRLQAGARNRRPGYLTALAFEFSLTSQSFFLYGKFNNGESLIRDLSSHLRLRQLRRKKHLTLLLSFHLASHHLSFSQIERSISAVGTSHLVLHKRSSGFQLVLMNQIN